MSLVLCSTYSLNMCFVFDSDVVDGLADRRMSLRSYSQRLSSTDMNQSMYSTSSAASTTSVPRKYLYCHLQTNTNHKYICGKTL